MFKFVFNFYLVNFFSHDFRIFLRNSLLYDNNNRTGILTIFILMLNSESNT